MDRQSYKLKPGQDRKRWRGRFSHRRRAYRLGLLEYFLLALTLLGIGVTVAMAILDASG